MGWPALATAGTMAAATRGETHALPQASESTDAAGQEPWVFADIDLAPRNAAETTPSRVVVRIEAELLGFVVEERLAWRRRRTWRTRKSYTTTRSDAVVEAGRIAHSWLSRGYAVCPH
jgi:hypothetical protein